MEISYLYSFIIFIVVTFVQTEADLDFTGASFNSGSADFAERSKEETNSTTGPIEASLCPDNSIISPCTCEILSTGLRIRCTGPGANESTTQNVFRAIRRVNGIPEDRGVGLSWFILERTELAQLDLEPFYGSRIQYFFIQYNYNLRKLVTSGDLEDNRTIQALNFYVIDSPLSRQGFGETLKYFSNDMTTFHLSNLPLTDANTFEGFLPGLSTLVNLRTLQIENCSLLELDFERWDFHGLQHIEEMSFRANNLTKIGEDVFNFDLFDADEDQVVSIYLSENQLNETSFHPNSGLARTGRNTKLYLSYNTITSLPSQIFETFLDAHAENFLDLYEIPLICDQRLSWIKARKEDFYDRVWTTGCTNDPGHDMFDSNLIP